MASNSLSPSTAVDTPPPKADVDDFLRRKRKVREHKACYPCRQRKVRCDLNRPCKTCVEREHPELCDYHPPAKRQNVGASNTAALTHEDSSGVAHRTAANTPNVTLSHGEFSSLLRKLDGLESNIEDLRRELRSSRHHEGHHSFSETSPSTPLTNGRPAYGAAKPDLPIDRATLPGFHTKNPLTGQTVYIGSILPLFGLDNETATYPFVDLWGLANGWTAKAMQLAKTIPGDAQCIGFLNDYRELGHVIYPGLADIAGFEIELNSFLANRQRYMVPGPDQGEDGMSPGVTEQSLYERDFNWIGLLFAVLSSGCQSSSLPRKERELTSQVYGSYTFFLKVLC